MKPKHLYIIAISWLVLTVVFCFSLTKGEQSIRQEINRAFREAIDRHYAERVEIFQRFHTPDVNPYAEYYITAPICGRKIKSYELRTWNSTTLFVFKDSTDETKARRLLNEHILAQANPIDADKLNTLLQARLASEGITGKTVAATLQPCILPTAPRLSRSTSRETSKHKHGQTMIPLHRYGISTIPSIIPSSS